MVAWMMPRTESAKASSKALRPTNDVGRRTNWAPSRDDMFVQATLHSKPRRRTPLPETAATSGKR
jgi:hypothetical protein